MRRNTIIAITLLLLFVCMSCSDKPSAAVYSPGTYSLKFSHGGVEANAEWVVNIPKDPDRDFVILNLTDIQLGTTAFIQDWDYVRKMIDSLVEQTKPDLITITGDISYGCVPSFYGICSHINSYGIPWAPVFGNHDCEDSGMSPSVQSKVLMQFSNCLFREGPKDLAIDPTYGFEQKGNYVVNIVGMESNCFHVVKSLVFVNSGTMGLSENQRQWCLDCVHSVAPSSAAVIMHIPTDGFRAAAAAAFAKNRYNVTLEESYTDNTVWGTGYEDSFGVSHEGIDSRGSVPFRTYAESAGNIDLMLCGHDHVNCTCITYNGIKYVFSLKTGPGCYYEEGLQGGTMITVSNSGEVAVDHIFYSE